MPDMIPRPDFTHLPQEEQNNPEGAIKKYKSPEFISLLLIGISDKGYWLKICLFPMKRI